MKLSKPLTLVLLWIAPFFGLMPVGANANPTSIQLEGRTVVSSSVGLDISAAPLVSHPKARSNRATVMSKLGDTALADFGNVDVASSFGTMGKVFDTRKGMRLVIELLFSTRISAARAGELRILIQPNLADGFSRVAVSQGGLDWSASDGTELSPALPYRIPVPVGASQKALEFAFDVNYTLAAGQKNNLIMLDLIASL